MNASPLPFISRMYFFFAISPETLAALNPAFDAPSVKVTVHFSFRTAAQTNPASRSGNRRMSLTRGRHEDILRLSRECFFFSQIAQLRKFQAGGFCFLRAILPGVDLRHFEIGQRIFRV